MWVSLVHRQPHFKDENMRLVRGKTGPGFPPEATFYKASRQASKQNKTRSSTLWWLPEAEGCRVPGGIEKKRL